MGDGTGSSLRKTWNSPLRNEARDSVFRVCGPNGAAATNRDTLRPLFSSTKGLV